MSTRTESMVLALLGITACGGDSPCDPDAPGTICTIAGEGKQGFGGDNGPATEAFLSWPQDTAVSPDGEVWVLDFNNYLVRAIDAGGEIRTVIGSGLLGDSPAAGEENCAALDAKFNHTTGILFHDNYLYLAAWHNSRVKRLDLTTNTLENFAGAGKRTLYTGDDGPALAATFDLPTAMAFDSAGNMAVMDQANQVIRQVDTNGMIHRIAGKCVIELAGPCDAPVLCPGSNKLVCGTPAQAYCGEGAGTTAGYIGTNDCSLGFGGDGGPALDLRMGQEYGQMAHPSGRLAYDKDDNLIFADSTNHRIRKINKSDGIVNTIAGNGSGGYSGDGGPATAAEIKFPVDVLVAPDGSILFADFENSCIRKIDTAGTISTVAGRCSPNPADWGFSGDGGSPTDATLNQPSGIDLVGNKLYISDTYNNRIRVVNL